MAEDYESAAARHFQDADLLKTAGKFDNAGHLIGFAAECAIKHKMTSLHTMSGSPHGHLPDILIIARKHFGQRAGYTSMFDVIKADIFVGWNVNRRYLKTGNTSTAELNAWFSATKRIFATAGLKSHR